MPYLSQSPTQNWKCLPEGPWCRELLHETYWTGTVTFDYLYWQKDQHYEITNFSKRRGNGKSDGLNEIRTPLQHGIQPASLYIYNYFVIVAETRWNLCLFPFFLGSGYVFLLLFRLTKEDQYLYRAQKFSEFMQTEEFQKGARTPDAPFSLYEGLAGTVCFYANLLNPSEAVFPFFEVF